MLVILLWLWTLCLLFSFPKHCQFFTLSFSSGRSPIQAFSFNRNLTRLYCYLLLFYLCVFLGDFLWLHQLSNHLYNASTPLFIIHTWFPLGLTCWSQDDLPEFLLWFYQPGFVSFPGILLSCNSEYKLGPYKLCPSVGHSFITLSCILSCSSLFWASYAHASLPLRSALIHFFQTLF